MGEMTLRQALDEYVSVYMAYRNFADRTRVEYKNDLEDLVGYLERSQINRVEELKIGQIERYLAHLEDIGFAGATRKRKTVSIRSFLTFLYHDGYIASNIAKHIIPPFTDNKLPAFLTETEYNRLRNACSGNTRDAAIVELLLQTGIKLSELTRLKIDDIELQEVSGLVRIRGVRGKEDRLLPLNHKAREAIITYLAERPDASSSILFLNRFEEPFRGRGVQKMLSKYLKKAELERASVHTLRHTFGTHHTINGTGIEILKKIMGHKDVRSTILYAAIAQVVAKGGILDNSL